MEKRIAVLIPSYNEARTIGRIVGDLQAKSFAVYVVDDGSVDDTARLAEKAGAEVISHLKNMGKGASLRDGFRRILADGFNEVITMDGDGQHRTGDIEKFVRAMKDTGAGIVIGNRMLDTSSMPPLRIWVNHFMSGLLSAAAFQRIPDSQCGFKLIKKDVLREIDLETSNFEIESELVLKAARKGFKIESVPIETVYRDEKSKIRPFLDTVRFIIFILKSLITSRRKR